MHVRDEGSGGQPIGSTYPNASQPSLSLSLCLPFFFFSLSPCSCRCTPASCGARRTTPRRWPTTWRTTCTRPARSASSRPRRTGPSSLRHSTARPTASWEDRSDTIDAPSGKQKKKFEEGEGQAKRSAADDQRRTMAGPCALHPQTHSFCTSTD